MEEQYPSYSEIISNSIVSSEMQNYWQQTKNFASYSARKEFGFWIYLDTQTGLYHCEDIPNINVATCSTYASIQITPLTSYRPYYSPLDQPYEYVGVFHTHTPYTYCTLGYKVVGPSPADRSYANLNNVPGIVYDYIGSDGILNAGHLLNEPATDYHFGPDRRSTRQF